MNKYLEKIAKEYVESVHVQDSRPSSVLGAAVTGGVTAGIANKLVGGTIQNNLVRPMLDWDPSVSNEVLDRIKADVLPRTNTTLKTPKTGVLAALMEASGPAYYDKGSLNAIAKLEAKFTGTPAEHYTQNVINQSHFKNTDALVHELGHAVDFNKLRRVKNLVGTPSRVLSGLPAAVLGGAALSNEKTRDYAWTVPIAVSLPMLREEAAANLNASRLVAKHGGDPKLLHGLFSRNLLSYATPTALAAGALYGVNKLRRNGEEVDLDGYGVDR